jgi:hypothetical protein
MDKDMDTGGGRPHRVQLSRQKGWRMPPNTVNVARPSRWGNFYRIGQPMCPDTIRRWGHRLRDFSSPGYCCRDAADAVRRFAAVIVLDEAIHPLLRQELAGKNLACWCPPGQPCHADVLLELANAPPLTSAQA